MTASERAKLVRIMGHALTVQTATDIQVRKQAAYDLSADLRRLPDTQVLALTSTVDTLLDSIAVVLRERR